MHKNTPHYYKDAPGISRIIGYRESLERESISTDDMWNTSYCGAIAIQAWQDFMIWEEFLNSVGEIRYLYEIGTFLGGFSLYLLHQARARNATFQTFDIENMIGEHTSLWSELESRFVCVDVFSEDFAVFAKRLSEPGSGCNILFCDGGNKPKEMQDFVPLLRHGDYVVVHDWGNEIGEADIDGLPLKPCMVGETEAVGSLTRFFQKI